MSLIEAGQRIACDGEGCLATAHAPVALRSGQPCQKGHAGQDWLFALAPAAPGSPSGEKHFCPCCAPLYLARRGLTR